MNQDRFAGIIGLAPKSSEKQLEAFVEQVKQINRFSETDQLDSMFSFYLTSKPNQPGSFVTFGGYDLSKYAKPGAKKDDIFWGTLVHSERYWTLNMAQISLNE